MFSAFVENNISKSVLTFRLRLWSTWCVFRYFKDTRLGLVYRPPSWIRGWDEFELFWKLKRFLKINIRLGLMLFLVFHKETYEIILPRKRSTPSYPPLSFNNLPVDQRKRTDFCVIVTSVMKNRIGHNWTHRKFFRW